MFFDLLQVGLLICTVLLAIITVELENMLHAVLGLCGMFIILGMLYWLLNAPYVAVFQLLIYAGAVIVLFIAIIMLTKREEG